MAATDLYSCDTQLINLFYSHEFQRKKSPTAQRSVYAGKANYTRDCQVSRGLRLVLIALTLNSISYLRNFSTYRYAERGRASVFGVIIQRMLST